MLIATFQAMNSQTTESEAPLAPLTQVAPASPRDEPVEPKPDARTHQEEQAHVITAAPELRNLQSETTKFIPVALIRNRMQQAKKAKQSKTATSFKPEQKKSVDEEFNDFLEEMKTLA
ncbi:hypothetical protein QR680_004493 [Steinernema hermaphroditum]|uniref:Uncharacterized protein n=1 Tax=Steinernema hermaphroditum TaxID=289476 RepID=A0AA39HR66_9BILA|nr:hypothetical protein QR680_004493 [Steinernema hermaphroditum]